MRDSLLAVAGQLDRDDGRPRRSTSPTPPFDRRDGLRLHRPPEPARHVPHVRLRQPRHAQPAAVHHDRAAAGAVHDEQPVRRSSRRSSSRRGRRSRRRRTPPSASRSSTARCFGRAPTQDELALGAEVHRSRGRAAEPSRRREPTRLAVRLRRVTTRRRSGVKTSRRCRTSPAERGRAGAKLPDAEARLGDARPPTAATPATTAPTPSSAAGSRRATARSRSTARSRTTHEDGDGVRGRIVVQPRRACWRRWTVAQRSRPTRTLERRRR